MSRLRLLLVWLLFAAVPLQGFAARTLLFCGGPGAPVQHAEAHPAGHGGHGTHAHAHASPADEQAGSVAAEHACGNCMACCHNVAAVHSAEVPHAAAPPAWQAPEPLLRIASRATVLPDKPPRG